MSALYGRLENERGAQSTRCAHRDLATTAETWSSVIRVELFKDGSFEIYLSGKQGEDRVTLAMGNADARAVQLLPYFGFESPRSVGEISCGAWSFGLGDAESDAAELAAQLEGAEIP